MFLLLIAALLFASFFVIVLPAGVLGAALLLHLRRAPKPEVQQGSDSAERHLPLEEAS